MIGKIGLICTLLMVLMVVQTSRANPIIGKSNKINLTCERVTYREMKQIISDSAGEMDFLGICLRNCAQCKKMYGSYFEGQMCADACVKFKGKIIPGVYLEDFLFKAISVISCFNYHFRLFFLLFLSYSIVDRL